MTRLLFTPEADGNLSDLEGDKGLANRLKAVRKALGCLETNPRHKSPHTHEYASLKGLNGEKVFGAYAENQTPAAYRIFCCCGPGDDEIAIIAITQHP